MFLSLLGSLSVLSLLGKDVRAAESINPSELATCLSGKNYIMYGRDGCSACALEKEYFGEAFQYVNYVNCSESAEKRLFCENRGISAYPTWEDTKGNYYKGAIPLAKLAEISGCTSTVFRINDQEELYEDQTQVNYWREYGWVFLAGLISFFAPCLIPLMPSYLSIITGYTFAELYGLEYSLIRGRVFKSALFFVLGFAIVFTILGATGSIFGQFITSNMPYLLKFSGLILIFLGLIQLQVIKPPSWEFDYAWRVQRKLAKLGFASASITGVASALCWIPCVGPILASVLLLAGNSQSVLWGMSYLFVYSLGVMLPFLLAALFFPRFFDIYRERRHVLKYFSIVSGVIIIAFGLVLIFNKYGEFINLYYSILKFLGIDFSLERFLER